MYEIYGLHSGDGVIRYVGQTKVGLARRLTTHKANAKANARFPSQHWIMKHGPENIRIVLLDTADTLEDANRLEVEWITRMNGTGALLNVTTGGDGAPGYAHTPESRAKISAATRGRKRTPEQRATISAAIRAKGRSPKQSEHARNAVRIGQERRKDYL